MLLDVCLGNRTTWKILSILAEAPGKALSRREIKEYTYLGNKVIDKFMLSLELFEVIKTNKISQRIYYKLNLNNQFVILLLDLLKAEKKELESLDLKVMLILREFIYGITNLETKNIKKIILFGSYAKRTFNENSDLDLAIILEQKNPTEQLLIADLSEKLKQRFGKELQCHYFEEKEFQQKSKLIEEIKKDGIVLLP